MPILSDLEKGLQKAVKDISGHPELDFDNQEQYEPAFGVRWWRVSILPDAAQLLSAGRLIKHTGLLSIDVFVPRNKGKALMYSDLDSIFSVFNTNNILVYGEASIHFSAPYTQNMLHEDVWFHGAIKIPYICYNK